MALEKFPTDAEMDLWVSQGLNIYMEGAHGIGKTEIGKAVAKRLKLKSKYFSVPTLDPWVNFVGVPRESKKLDKDGNRYLDFLLPREMSSDLEIIILDEYPRAKAAIRNAVMELIQFRTINGRPFPKLKSIIAMANPHDDEGTYDGERIDPAQLDRFHVHVNMPYAINEVWAAKKYGSASSSIVAWWQGLAPNVRRAVSPRRVAQAYDAVRAGVDPEAMLPYSANLAAFEQICREGSSNTRLRKAVGRIAEMAIPLRAETSAQRLALVSHLDVEALIMAQADEIKAAVAPLKRNERAVVFAHLPTPTLERLCLLDLAQHSWFGKWFISSAQRIPDSVFDSLIDQRHAIRVFQWGSTVEGSKDEITRAFCKDRIRSMSVTLGDLNGTDVSGIDEWEATSSRKKR